MLGEPHSWEDYAGGEGGKLCLPPPQNTPHCRKLLQVHAQARGLNIPRGSEADLGKGGRRQHRNCTHDTQIKEQVLYSSFPLHHPPSNKLFPPSQTPQPNSRRITGSFPVVLQCNSSITQAISSDFPEKTTQSHRSDIYQLPPPVTASLPARQPPGHFPACRIWGRAGHCCFPEENSLRDE